MRSGSSIKKRPRALQGAPSIEFMGETPAEIDELYSEEEDKLQEKSRRNKTKGAEVIDLCKLEEEEPVRRRTAGGSITNPRDPKGGTERDAYDGRKRKDKISLNVDTSDYEEDGENDIKLLGMPRKLRVALTSASATSTSAAATSTPDAALQPRDPNRGLPPGAFEARATLFRVLQNNNARVGRDHDFTSSLSEAEVEAASVFVAAMVKKTKVVKK